LRQFLKQRRSSFIQELFCSSFKRDAFPSSKNCFAADLSTEKQSFHPRIALQQFFQRRSISFIQELFCSSSLNREGNPSSKNFFAAVLSTEKQFLDFAAVLSEEKFLR
jgi:hypothetical protein